jgi:hypothetical protein
VVTIVRRFKQGLLPFVGRVEKSRVAQFVTPAPVKSNTHLEGRFGAEVVKPRLKPCVLFAGVDRRSSIHLLHC